jgi:hypothetical protein
MSVSSVPNPTITVVITPPPSAPPAPAAPPTEFVQQRLQQLANDGVAKLSRQEPPTQATDTRVVVVVVPPPAARQGEPLAPPAAPARGPEVQVCAPVTAPCGIDLATDPELKLEAKGLVRSISSDLDKGKLDPRKVALLDCLSELTNGAAATTSPAVAATGTPKAMSGTALPAISLAKDPALVDATKGLVNAIEKDLDAGKIDPAKVEALKQVDSLVNGTAAAPATSRTPAQQPQQPQVTVVVMPKSTSAPAAAPSTQASKPATPVAAPGSAAETRQIEELENDLQELIANDAAKGRIDPAKIQQLKVLQAMKADPDFSIPPAALQRPAVTTPAPTPAPRPGPMERNVAAFQNNMDHALAGLDGSLAGETLQTIGNNMGMPGRATTPGQERAASQPAVSPRAPSPMEQVIAQFQKSMDTILAGLQGTLVGDVLFGGGSAEAAQADAAQRYAAKSDKTSAAAGTLADYMDQKGIQSLDKDQLYKLGANASGDVPPEVQQAAKFMLRNPEIYKAIETADVPGADGISGRANFEKVAKGDFGKELSEAIATEIDKPQTSFETKKEQALDASRTLAEYMRNNGMAGSLLNLNQLAELGSNKSGNVPKEVQEAANFLAEHPNLFNRIETVDVKTKDGLISLGDLDHAAKALEKQAPDRPKPDDPVTNSPWV